MNSYEILRRCFLQTLWLTSLGVAAGPFVFAPRWSPDSRSVFYTAKIGENVELFQITLDGQAEQLTHSAEGTLHYHPTPSPDGRWIVYGSKRSGVRNLFVMRLSDRKEHPLTDVPAGHAAMHAYWQPFN